MRRPDLGTLKQDSVADVAIFRLEEGGLYVFRDVTHEPPTGRQAADQYPHDDRRRSAAAHVGESAAAVVGDSGWQQGVMPPEQDRMDS